MPVEAHFAVALGQALAMEPGPGVVYLLGMVCARPMGVGSTGLGFLATGPAAVEGALEGHARPCAANLLPRCGAGRHCERHSVAGDKIAT